MTNSTRNMAVIDIETGGFSKTKNGLAEIGVLIIDSNGTEIVGFSWLIQPYERDPAEQEHPGHMVSYKDDAMQVNCLTVEQLEKDGVAADVVALAVCELLDHYQVNTMIAHNAKGMEKPWLEYFLSRFAGGFIFDEIHCTLEMARGKVKGLPSYKLGDLCSGLGIEMTDAHRAMGDVRATHKLYMHLKLLGA